MGIYIKGMEMPQNCIACPLFEDRYHYHGCHAVPKSFNDMDMWNFVGERPPWCPLVELPPHGRLIDGDAFRQAMYHEAFETNSPMQKWDSGCWIRYKMFEQLEEAAPTIIEAEE